MCLSSSWTPAAGPVAKKIGLKTCLVVVGCPPAWYPTGGGGVVVVSTFLISDAVDVGPNSVF